MRPLALALAVCSLPADTATLHACAASADDSIVYYQLAFTIGALNVVEIPDVLNSR